MNDHSYTFDRPVAPRGFSSRRSALRLGVLCVVLLVGSATALGQPGSAAPAPSAPAPATPSPTPPAAGTAAQLRETCAQAMNADPSFATAIVKTINESTAKQHVDAARRIAKNERHVILAYVGMWLVAAAFVLFLWRRQQLLRSEIVQLRRDLDAATNQDGPGRGRGA